VLDWACDLINPGSWATVSSFVALGLTWWEACLAVFVGGVLVAVVITGKFLPLIWIPRADKGTSANGYVGAKVSKWEGSISPELILE
jgi:NCS1 family nucleobase:cation symporter-1